MSFGVSVCRGYVDNGVRGHDEKQDQKCERVLTCYTPTADSIGNKVVSLVNHQSHPKCVVSSQDLATIPGGAIIDSIEYEGFSFSAKGNFTLGLGELNHAIMVPLIENGTSMIANENAGGCRQFLAEAEDGQNTKVKVPYTNYVNFVCEGGVQNGSLRVDIYYHIKR